MMSPHDRIPVGILGATGTVGRRLAALLHDHPLFELRCVAASERSVGQEIAGLPIQACSPDLPCELVFSALDASIAGPVEESFARAGYTVISNARNHRMEPHIPLVVPEVNPEQLEWIRHQPYQPGCIVTNPNCSTIGLVMALKPLLAFGLEKVHVVSLQAVSGAGSKIPDIDDNVIPHIAGEEEKIETEPCKILGKELSISAQCNRVPVSDGHLLCVSVGFSQTPSCADLIQAWTEFRGLPQELALPSAPQQPIHVFDRPDYPQPRLHRDLEKGMAVSIGALRPCRILDYKFNVLSHNTLRGAAGGTILLAEQLVTFLSSLPT